MRVLVRPQIRQESGNQNFTISLKLLESVIDGRQSLLSYVISNIIDKLAISDATGPRKCIFDCSYLLRGQEYAASIEQQIEGMVRETALITGIVFGDLGVEGDKIVVSFTEELEFEFIIDLCQRVDPVHVEVIIIIASNTFISIYIAKNIVLISIYEGKNSHFYSIVTITKQILNIRGYVTKKQNDLNKLKPQFRFFGKILTSLPFFQIFCSI